MAALDDSMDMEMEEEEMDADDVNVIMPPPRPSIFPVRAASHWSDLSEDWNAEETGRARPAETLYGAGIHKITGRNNRGYVEYEDEEFGNDKAKVATRLDFQKRKAAWAMNKVQPTLTEVDDEDEGEIHSGEEEDGEEDNVGPEDNDNDSAWSKRLKGPRMRMYADEEEARHKRNQKIKELYGQGEQTTSTKLQVQVDFQAADDRRISTRDLKTRRLSRDETTTGIGQVIIDEGFGLSTHRQRRNPDYDEDDFRRRNLYTENLDRVAHRTIDGHRNKGSIKDRLGFRPKPVGGDGSNRLSVKDRLGTRRFQGRE